MTMQNTAKPTTFSSENLHGLEVDFIGDQNIILLQPYDRGSIDEEGLQSYTESRL